MPLSLDMFEQQVEETILKRGYKYWQDGNVDEVEELSPGWYLAIVTGSEDYEVTIETKGNQITHHQCNCPYDMGDVCKHVVAVLFALQEEELFDGEMEPKKNKGKAVKPKVAPKKKATTTDLLERIPPLQLKEFLTEQINKNKDFKASFMLRFTNYLVDETKQQSHYQTIIKQQIKAATKQGYIDYHAVKPLANKLSELLRLAEQAIASQNYNQVLAIALPVIVECSNLLYEIEDSNGRIGDTIAQAIELLSQLTTKELEKEIRLKVIEECLKLANTKTLSDWSYPTDLLDTAATLVSTDEEDVMVTKAIESYSNQHTYGNYELVMIRAKLLHRKKGEAAVKELLYNERAIPQIREQLITEAYKKKEYNNVKKIAMEAIDKTDRTIYTSKWKAWVLKAEEGLGNTQATIMLAEELFAQFNNDQIAYYNTIKKLTPTNEWPEQQKKLLAIANKNANHSLAKIYIMEEMWEELMSFVASKDHYSYIYQYEKYLVKHFPERVENIYERTIKKLAANSNNRGQYIEVCKILSNFKEINPLKAKNTIGELRSLYPKRKAFMDELKAV
ncbi:hypothetical protein BH09BAC1_BH09BAC1_13170 [soil metagenome]